MLIKSLKITGKIGVLFAAAILIFSSKTVFADEQDLTQDQFSSAHCDRIELFFQSPRIDCEYNGDSYDSLEEAYSAYLTDQTKTRLESTKQPPAANTLPNTGDFGTGVAGLSNKGLFNNTNPADSTDDALNNLELFLSRLVGGLTTLSTFFFLLYFVLGTFSWITAGGDQSKISKARDQMVQGALGMIVIVGAYSVIGTIGTVLGLKLLNPADQLRTVFGVSDAPAGSTGSSSKNTP